MTLWKTHPTLIMAESMAQRSPNEPGECMTVAAFSDPKVREKEDAKIIPLGAKANDGS